METQQMVSNPAGVTPAGAQAGGRLRLATIQVDLKPERVQDPPGTAGAVGAASSPTVSVRLAIHQSQTVTLGPSGPALAITFTDNGAATGGTPAPAA